MSWFTAEEEAAIEALAQRRGFDDLREYIQSLVTQDAELHGEEAPLSTDEDVDELAASFRIAWDQALRGEVLTYDELKRAFRAAKR